MAYLSPTSLPSPRLHSATSFAAFISGKPSVYHLRNVHNVTDDMKLEYLGYEKSLDLVGALFKDPKNIFKYLPEGSAEAFHLYQRYFI
jgi:hypothetical protein